MEKKLSINSENILPIIKKWLYSEKDIFIRELVSNSTDAISKVKILDENLKDFFIKISINKKKKTLKISDNGIGMSFSEVEKYISEIAFSGAEDFFKKYEKTNDKETIIGHFGLGFYSSFMVSKKVAILTQSFDEKEDSVYWLSDGSSNYEIDKTDKVERGTEITLFLNDDDDEYLDELKIKSLLLKYCQFFPYPIYLNDKQINNKDPLWLKKPIDCTEEEYKEFYRDLYPFDKDPIFWIHLNIDYPFNLKGILYFPKIDSNFDLQKSDVKLFSNRVFVTDNVKDILPQHLTVLKGAIDSIDIPLNVSRSYLQVDKTVKQLGVHISKKIADKLNTFYKEDNKKFITIWKDIEIIIKLGLINDDKFYDKSKDFIIFENLNGEYTTIEEYLKRNEKQKKVFYCNKDKYSESFLSLYKEKNIEVVYTNPYVDSAIITLLEQKLNTNFVRIDGSIDESIIDKSKEKTLLDEGGQTIGTKLSQYFKNLLSQDIEVEAKSLSNDSVPSFIMIKEEDRRFSDYMSFSQNQNFPTKHTLVINTNNKLINKIFALRTNKPEISRDLALSVYDSALLSQKELKIEDFSKYIKRSNDLLEKLTETI